MIAFYWTYAPLVNVGSTYRFNITLLTSVYLNKHLTFAQTCSNNFQMTINSGICMAPTHAVDCVEIMKIGYVKKDRGCSVYG